MKILKISEPVFRTSLTVSTGCSEKTFVNNWNKKHEFQIEDNYVYGKTIIIADDIHITIWINRKDNIETFTHELTHAIRSWMQEYLDIVISKDTDEMYAYLMSFYMREYLNGIGLKRLTTIGK